MPDANCAKSWTEVLPNANNGKEFDTANADVKNLNHDSLVRCADM
jgi:hypothetical protein